MPPSLQVQQYQQQQQLQLQQQQQLQIQQQQPQKQHHQQQPLTPTAAQKCRDSPFRLAFSLSVIYGSFTLGFYVAIQGPTLMDLIDLLHVNNDIMSYSLAFASLAYALGGLLSGFLFNYVDRQILIPGYYIVFGVANAITPYISNYYIFSAITVFKMMCAGGTDCGANVWILDMWPGQDAWLQALHFSFACGTALGPLVVEPFLSAGEHKDNTELEARLKDNNGHALISDQSSESRIYIPYGVSGFASLVAAFCLIYLHLKEERHTREQKRLRTAKQLAASGEHILMNAIQHPAAIEAAKSPSPSSPTTTTPVPNATTITTTTMTATSVPAPANVQNAQQQIIGLNVPETIPEEVAASNTVTEQQDSIAPTTQQANQILAAQSLPVFGDEKKSNHQMLANMPNAGADPEAAAQLLLAGAKATSVKFSSKAKEHDGRPPYYVMFAIALCALCLSFYCGIEITSMNYLATFAVNIELQLPKSTAALMSSALTISFAVGRLIGIWIAAYMQPHKLFYLCSCVMAAGNLCILLFANTAEIYLWYSICLFGIGCGPMYASIVSFYDDRISKVTNTVSGIFILGSMFNVALNSLIIGHYIIDNALILIVCNLIGSVFLLFLFGGLHMLTRVKKNQRKRKFKLQQLNANSKSGSAAAAAPLALVEATAASAHAPVDPNAITASTPLQAPELEPVNLGKQEYQDKDDVVVVTTNDNQDNHHHHHHQQHANAQPSNQSATISA